MPEALRYQTWSMVFTGIELGDENDITPEVLSKVLDAKMFLARPSVSTGQ